MNGNSVINGNGHQEYNSTSVNNDISVNGKSLSDNKNNTGQFQNKLPPKSASQHMKMATNGNASFTDEHDEDSFVDVTRRYKLMSKISQQRDFKHLIHQLKGLK